MIKGGYFGRKIYKELAEVLDKNVKDKSNFLILTLPGLGLTHEIKEYLNKKGNRKIKYINQGGEELVEFNILDLDFDKSEKAFEFANDYFKKADLGQKFALILNLPHLVNSLKYKRAYFASHIYSIYYFRVHNFQESKEFSLRTNKELTEDKVEKIYRFSGGIARINRFLCLNTDFLDKNIVELVKNKSFIRVINQTVKAILFCDEIVLEKIGVKRKGKFVGLILKKYFQFYPLPFRADIKVNKDLSFEENNQSSQVRFTKTEAEIVKYLLVNSIINREKVADFKWGKGGYDKFSDWAINQTVMRINRKLKYYRLQTVPKIGYKISLK